MLACCRSLYEFGAESQEAKLRCLLNYYSRIVASTPQGAISFERKVLPMTPAAVASANLKSSSSSSPSGTLYTQSTSSPGSGGVPSGHQGGAEGGVPSGHVAGEGGDGDVPSAHPGDAGGDEFGDGTGLHQQHYQQQQMSGQQYQQQLQQQGQQQGGQQQQGSQGAGHGHGTVLHFPVPPGIEFWKARQSPLCAFKVQMALSF